MRHLSLIVLCLLPLSLSPARAEDPKPPTIDQWANLKWVHSPCISPDGRFVVYEQREPDRDYGFWKFEIWTAEVANGKCRRLSDDDSSAFDPQWTPDGERVAFLSNRDGEPQVYAVSPTGKKGKALTNFPTGVHSFRWSPDGRWIAFEAKEPEKKEKDENAALKKYIRFGEFDEVGGDDRYRLWVTDVKNAEKTGDLAARRLTGDDCAGIAGYEWSPDSNYIAFSATPRGVVDPIDALDVYVATLADGSLRRVAWAPGPQLHPMWSPDGKDLVFESAGDKPYAFYCGRIEKVSAFSGPVHIVRDNFNERPSLVAWTPRGVFIRTAQRTGEALSCIDPETGDVKPVTTAPQGDMEDTTISADGRMVAWLGADATGFSEVFVSPLDGFAPKQLTTLGDQLKTTRLAKREIVTWKSNDGSDVEGVLIKPADFNPSTKYPLLVAIHGGPAGVSQMALQSDHPYPLEVLAAKGAVILEPNYRGSCGYGLSFRIKALGNPGPGEAEDILSGVDALAAKGFVDTSRMGVMGWSYGGFLAAWLSISTDRFKAASVGGGLVDWRADYTCSDSPQFARQFLKGTPWDIPAAYDKASPVNAGANKTPTLIQHGEYDDRVPIASANMLYRALKDRDVPVKFIIYRDMGHSPVMPGQLRSLMQHNYDWFLEHIWGEKPAAQ
ncbi:MAG TPA: S9 family peptidase [Armatimonadota bacterium]|jgi:dipeptidyl aminopeptidase/acylaminoacyl peptidase